LLIRQYAAIVVVAMADAGSSSVQRGGPSPRPTLDVVRGVIETALAVLLMAALGGALWFLASLVLHR